MSAAVGLGLIASIAATGASAVTLCRANENPTCAEANRYKVPTEFEAKLARTTSATFGPTPSVTCEASVGLGETTTAGTPLLGEVTSLSFGSCTGCTMVEARNLPWKGEIEATGGGNGTISLTAGSANPGVKMTSCLSGATCAYGSPTATAAVEGGFPATVAFSVELTREEGTKPLCALTSKFTATYHLVKPEEPIFISALP
ncbi:MAG TPA: hypothetical protein VF009_05020 [Solirubrobacterales bacterium]